MYFAYLLRCSDDTFYAGSTNDLQAREARHNAGRGGKYTAGRLPVRMVFSESFETQREAMARERELKTLTREEKEELCRQK